MKKEPTLREKAALFALAAGFIDNWVDAYKVAYNGKIEHLDEQKSLLTSVSRWKNSAVVANYFESLKAQHDTTRHNNGDGLKESEKETGKDKDNTRADNTRTTAKGPQFIDFSNPENQTAKLNELINTATDGGEALDALKVIIQSQRADREAAKDGKVVRAYLPISCVACPLYKLQVKKHSEKL